MATLKVPESIAPATEDAESLRKAFEGWLTNGNVISSILAHRNASQRKAIQDAYRQAYGEDLLSVIDKELSSDFERLVMVWTMVPAERDAFLVNEATKMMSRSNWVIMEVGCTRSSHDLFMARHAYHARFKRSMEEDVAYHTSGPFRQLLVPLITAFRYEGPEVNTTLARKEAKILREKILEKAYTDEEFIRIISTRSKSQFNATINHYNDEFGNSINKDLKSDPEDEFLRLLRAAIKCLTRPEKYFEKVLRKAIIGLGTDEWALTRVVATRAEVDMLRIKEEYLRRNSEPLHKAIHGDTSGDYRNMLLTLVGRGE